MSDEEIQGLIQNAFQKTLKELQENPDNVFNYIELQEKYNRVLKDKVNLHQENKKLKDVIDKAIKYINNNSWYFNDEGSGAMFCLEEEKEETFCNDLLSILKEVK